MGFFDVNEIDDQTTVIDAPTPEEEQAAWDEFVEFLIEQQDEEPSDDETKALWNDKQNCTCCGGSGEHKNGGECYLCDASGNKDDMEADDYTYEWFCLNNPEHPNFDEHVRNDYGDDPEKYKSLNVKVRYVRTPEGSRRYGLPIGAPIIADVNGNPISHHINEPDAYGARTPKPSGAEAEGRPGRSQFEWTNVVENMYARGRINRYTVTVDNVREMLETERHGPKWEWRISVTGVSPWSYHEQISDDMDWGTAKTFTEAMNRAKREAVKRDREYQKETKRKFPTVFDDMPGVWGYDYTPSGRPPTAKEMERFENDSDYRWEKLQEHMLSRGIDYKVGGYYHDPRQIPSEVDVAALEKTMALLEYHEERWPGFFDLIGRIQSDNMAGNRSVIAYNGTEYRDGEGMVTVLGINSTMFNPDALDSGVRISTSYDRNNNWFAVDGSDIDAHVGDDYYEQWETRYLATQVHELGHTFANVGFGYLWEPDGRIDTEAKDEFAEGLWDIMYNWGMLVDQDITEAEFRDAVRKNEKHSVGGTTAPAPMMEFNRSVISEVLSLYGSTSLHEMIAEAWSEYLTDPTPRQFSVDIGDLLSDMMTNHLARRKARKNA